MSDLATSQDDGIFEPDEETLMSALRNQDDIPILMDIVSDADAFTSRQEAYLRQSFDDNAPDKPLPLEAHLAPSLPTSISNEPSRENEVESVSKDTVSVPTLAVSQDQVASAITAALERRLPIFMAELVAEVMQDLHAPSLPVQPAATQENPAHNTDTQTQTP
ncbi:hypothetical protein [Marinomonas sp. IMCC 4694]|uniref:hypothetical protein n=1 Tax=Marinomonas sp. IMCC 4694 TaxID=2605432 RepID=UPI0011E732BD|nr:hypothetical protein [Marinomonas sp. IMCC 4694]TYL46742.1 hypothetical protein FXV75_01630 [Marinomonas sp. IMCC 4694]